MRLGKVIERTKGGAEIRKAETRQGIAYFAWEADATVAARYGTLKQARGHLGITCERKAA